MLQPDAAGLAEQHVHDDPLRRSEDRRLDELFPLAAAAVTADELHPGSRQRDVEDPGVRGVHQIQPHHLPGLRGQRQIRFAADEQHVTEAAHRGVRRLGPAERSDLAVFEQDVVQGQDELAVDRRPVVRIGGGHHDGAVQAHLLSVVLPDVRVIPVEAGVREDDPRGEAAAHRDRVLRLMGSVEAVIQAQPVPVHRRVQVAVVGDVHHHLRAFPNPQGGSRNRPVVRQHPHRRVSELLNHRRHPQIEHVTAGQ